MGGSGRALRDAYISEARYGAPALVEGSKMWATRHPLLWRVLKCGTPAHLFIGLNYIIIDLIKQDQIGTGYQR